ncbi:MAG: hypothetical protein ACOX1Q_08610 [Eubacteriales bacterium]|jgi:bifunctional N-acetylglucosamine-1-phosphate-uridyltransferase/glucosamine-1-phosphate-acetyltransferase GlmU-like protein
MSTTMRTAAILKVNDEGRLLFEEELLFKKLKRWIAETLSECGIEELLLVVNDVSECDSRLGDLFSTFTRCDAGQVREALRELADNGHECVITISDTVFFDRDVIEELLDTLQSREKVVLTSGGSPIGVCGFSGEDAFDPLLILSALEGQDSFEDYYEIDCLDTGTLGLVTRNLEDICRAEELLRDVVNRRHMANGVRFVGADTCYISPDAKIGSRSIIYPNTIIKGSAVIGQGCKIGPNTVVSNCDVGDGTEINSSQVLDSTIGNNVKIGPFAYIRPGCQIGDDIRIGDFVELKKASIGDGTKISHLTYVGDAEVGRNVNFGCGTVTANYDGVAKHLTVIEDGAFIGCNTNLIAPVRVGKNATTAAGTTVTHDVPEGSLAIGRVRQSNKADWNKNRKKN